MNKQQFLDKLKAALHGLPQEDREERLAFYAEMIDDRMEEGMSEEEAVSQIGPVDEIVSKILDEVPLGKIAKERIRPERKLKVWEIVLLALGFPVWGSLLIAVLAIAFSLWVSVWAIVISLWAAEVAFAVSSVGAVMAAPIYAVQGYGASAAMMVACGLVLAGLSIFFFFGCKSVTKGLMWLTQKMILLVKKLFLRKEKEA